MKQVHAQEARDASAAPAPAGDDNKPQQAADEKSKSNDQPKK